MAKKLLPVLGILLIWTVISFAITKPEKVEGYVQSIEASEEGYQVTLLSRLDGETISFVSEDSRWKNVREGSCIQATTHPQRFKTPAYLLQHVGC